MRLVFSQPIGDATEAELAPGLAVCVSRSTPLPSDLEAWHQRVIGDAVLVELRRVTADAGWPMTLVRARGARADDTTHMLYAFYELFDRGVVVTVTARDSPCLTAAADRIDTLLRGADIDRHPHEVVALSQLWEEP